MNIPLDKNENQTKEKSNLNDKIIYQEKSKDIEKIRKKIKKNEAEVENEMESND